MIYLSERIKNIYGKYQWNTIIKDNDYFKVEAVFKNYNTSNRLEITSSDDGELLAVKLENITM